VVTGAGGFEHLADQRAVADFVHIRIPDRNGFDFIMRIRDSLHPHVQQIPAAALTAFARAEDRTKALQRGFEMHLAKPIDPGELVASVAAPAKRGKNR
jgi:CheY-like chemotaxis protein